MKFKIFWMWNPLFHTVWWLFDISAIWGWWKGTSRKARSSDISSSPTQGWDVCRVWWNLRTSQKLWLHNFQRRDEQTPPHICISTTHCVASPYLSLPLPLSASLILSLSHKEECHFVSGFLCLFSQEWCLNADSLQDFPPPVYILLIPKLNLMVKIRHAVTVFLLLFFLMEKWQINAMDLKGKWRIEEKRTINRVIRFILVYPDPTGILLPSKHLVNHSITLPFGVRTHVHRYLGLFFGDCEVCP